jgi:hypothetical protein
MLARLFFWLLKSALLSVGCCIVGVLLAYLLQGPSMAQELLRTWVVSFDGILVGAFGYGLMFFMRTTGRTLLAQLTNVLKLGEDDEKRLLDLHHRAVSWNWANLVSLPLTVVGAIILWSCGFPLQGFARWYLGVCSISIYYVASNMLAFFLFVLALFNFLEDRSDLRAPTRLQARIESPMDLEALNGFFILTSTAGIVAIYLGFRGTLTANFINTPPVFKNMLILPILLYLPATLCYSFYPRYVLRQITQRDTIMRIHEFEQKLETAAPAGFRGDLELKKLLLEVKEKMMAETSGPPLFGLKDVPSLTLSLLLLIQLTLEKDSVVAGFFDTFLKRK